MKKILIYVGIWLVVVNVFALVALNRFNLNPDTAYTWITPWSFPVPHESGLVDMHNRWDSYWYHDIVQNGYYSRGDGQLANVVFFPLYPFLIKVMMFFTLGNFSLAGWAVSIVFLFLSCAYIYKFVKEFHPDVEPEMPILLMLIFPTAFFLNVIYTESTFLFMTIATFYYAFRKNFKLAALFAFLGALTHSNGMFLALPIFWKMCESYGWKNWKSLISFKSWPILVAPLGTFLFVSYDYYRFKDPMLFFKIQSAWGRSFSINWDHFSTFSNPSITNMCIDITLAIFIITAVVIIWRKLSPLYALFMSATLFAAFSSGTLMSVGRYSLTMFPLFILLAKMKNKNAIFVWSLISVLFFALDIILWVNNYWAG